MATVQSVINSARYDLVDYVDGVGVGIEFDDAELLNYINRMVGLLDANLAALQSDLTEAEETSIDTVASQAYVDLSSMNSGLWTRIRSVWIGSGKLDQVNLNYLRYTSQFRSGDAEPCLWALWNQRILFPQGCDSAHTDLVIYYDKKTAELVISDSMPYFDIYNELIRETLVMCAKAKKEGILDRADATFNALFKMRSMQEEIGRQFVPRPYNYTEF